MLTHAQGIIKRRSLLRLTLITEDVSDSFISRVYKNICETILPVLDWIAMPCIGKGVLMNLLIKPLKSLRCFAVDVN
jgi:hypothetical protein